MHARALAAASPLSPLTRSCAPPARSVSTSVRAAAARAAPRTPLRVAAAAANQAAAMAPPAASGAKDKQVRDWQGELQGRRGG
jgi:hypothetical protein